MKPHRWVRGFIIFLFVMNIWWMITGILGIFFPKNLPPLPQVPASQVTIYHDENQNLFYDIRASYVQNWYSSVAKYPTGPVVAFAGINCVFLSLLVVYGRLPKRQ